MRLAAAAFLIATAAGAQTPRSYTYEFTLDTKGKDKDGPVHGTVRVSGGRARVDTDKRKENGDYILVSDGGQTVIVVHPKDGTYQEHDAEDFARIVGTALRAVGAIVKFDVRNTSVDTERLGAGGTFAGRSTQHYRVSQHWNTTVKVMGFGKELPGSADGEYWADPSLTLMRNPVFDIAATSMLALAATDDAFLSRSAGARERLFRGSPLKADIRMRVSGDDGDDNTRLRYEVTRFTPGAVDESALQPPKGYRREKGLTVSF